MTDYVNRGDVDYAQWQMARHKAICRGGVPPTLKEYLKVAGKEARGDGIWSMMRDGNKIRSKCRSKWAWRNECKEENDERVKEDILHRNGRQ